MGSVTSGEPSAERLPHGYTNSTHRVGSSVVKVYTGPDTCERQQREEMALRTLAGRLPVPRLLASEPGRLTTELAAGVHGQDLIDSGLAAEVLFRCGRLLLAVQRVPVRVVDPEADPNAIPVHGDFGPNNTLFTADGTAAVLLADWEWMHVGDPVTDLAWCEWIVRTHHRDRSGALDALFEGYGDRPDWSARQQAMLTRCHQHLEWCRRWPGSHRAEVWAERIARVSTWRELP